MVLLLLEEMVPCLRLGSVKNNTKSPIIAEHLGTGLLEEGGVRVCGDAVLRYFWCVFAVIFILTCGIAVSKH